ncbi:MAG: hypothetical protein JO023_13230, partial [Chloroflexi bacterium]|nr:hypothetical protein [Chloroflexota bacterium]
MYQSVVKARRGELPSCRRPQGASNPLSISALYAPLLQFVRKQAAIVFTVISAISFVVTLIPDVSYIPTVEGVSNAQVAVLVIMHAIAAAVITRGLTSIR